MRQESWCARVDGVLKDDHIAFSSQWKHEARLETMLEKHRNEVRVPRTPEVYLKQDARCVFSEEHIDVRRKGLRGVCPPSYGPEGDRADGAVEISRQH